MRRKTRRIAADDFRRVDKERFLVARDDFQIGKPRERSRVLTICLFRMVPRIEARWRLRQTGQKNCFAQSEIVSRLPEIRAGSGLRAKTSIPIAAAIQVFRENALLAPTPFQFPSDDCLVQFAAPTAPVTTAREFHELLRNRRCARNNLPRSQIPCARANGRPPIDTPVFVEPPVFERDGNTRQPRSHLLNRDWKLSP